jgi:hypothetical protein
MGEMNGTAAAIAAAEAAVRVNPEVVAQLEIMLQRAKAGEIVSMGAACIAPNGGFVPVIIGPRFGDMHLGLSFVTRAVLDQIIMVHQQQAQQPRILRPAGAVG